VGQGRRRTGSLCNHAAGLIFWPASNRSSSCSCVFADTARVSRIRQIPFVRFVGAHQFSIQNNKAPRLCTEAFLVLWINRNPAQPGGPNWSLSLAQPRGLLPLSARLLPAGTRPCQAPKLGDHSALPALRPTEEAGWRVWLRAQFSFSVQARVATQPLPTRPFSISLACSGNA
jgi:hypothetical protein